MRMLGITTAPSPASTPPPPPESTPPPPASSPPPPASSSPPPPPPATSSPPPPPPPAASSPPPPPPPAASSPPPPPLRKSPPPSNSTRSRGPPPPLRPGEWDDKNSDSSQSLAESISFSWQPPSNNDGQKKAIVGTVVGLGLFFMALIIVCIFCCRKKKKPPPKNIKDDHKNYYQQKSHNSGSPYYNNNQRHWQNNSPYSAMDGGGPMRYTPSPLGFGMETEQWTPRPPPPPAAMSTQSSMGFSGPPLPPPHPSTMWSGYNQSTFTYNDLAAATRGFAQTNLLGQGGFGYVHKGVLPNGKEIAVKSLKLNSGQGEREFQAEVDIISRVHHRHLVSLVGYCISGSQRLLVYEYVPNSTLEDHLHGTDRPTMDWGTRLKIALGAAKGFAYLHEDCHPRIIHRDIKAANILLDNNFEAKVADFGLAKLSSDNNTHISTRIMGTFGYLAPEYASSGKLTEKSDVYSFGIVLLELITGRRPVDITRDDDDDSLVDWARPILTNVAEGGSYDELVDPSLERNYDHAGMMRMVSSAAACIRQSSRRRPKMSQVVRVLEGDVSLDDLHEGMKGSLSASSSEYDLQRLQKHDSIE